MDNSVCAIRSTSTSKSSNVESGGILVMLSHSEETILELDLPLDCFCL